MSMTDPLADMFSRLMNGQSSGKNEVSVPFSKMKLAVSNVLKNEGYIYDFIVCDDEKHSKIKIVLKYFNGEPVISNLLRVSRPGKRVYKSKDKIPMVLAGLGISIISTSVGVLSDKQARNVGVGGEIICHVS